MATGNCSCGQPNYASGQCSHCYNRNWYQKQKRRLAADPEAAAEHRQKCRAATARWNTKHKPAPGERARKYKYGLVQAEFKRIYDTQRGMCPICLKTLEKPCVDHDHDTNKIRGLLCNHCNAGIGLLRDNPERLARATYYIKTARKPPVLRLLRLFLLGFALVFLVASNTQQIIGKHYVGASIVGFCISFLWGIGVQKVHSEGPKGALAYAVGAGCGTMTAMIIVPWFYGWVG